MATRLSNASQQAAADAVVDRVDAGDSNGLLRLYSGAQPADADSAPGGTLLLEIGLAEPAFGAAATTGIASALGTPLSGTGEEAAGAGTAAQSFRVVDSDGNTCWDGAVGAAESGAECVLDNVSIAEGQTVTITSLTYQQPAST